MSKTKVSAQNDVGYPIDRLLQTNFDEKVNIKPTIINEWEEKLEEKQPVPETQQPQSTTTHQHVQRPTVQKVRTGSRDCR